MIHYVENPKTLPKKPLELIHELSKVARYKINVQKLVAFLYTNNKAAESEIKELIPFAIAPKTIRDLGISLIKEVKIYTQVKRGENYKELMKENDDTKNGKIFHAH